MWLIWIWITTLVSLIRRRWFSWIRRISPAVSWLRLATTLCLFRVTHSAKLLPFTEFLEIFEIAILLIVAFLTGRTSMVGLREFPRSLTLWDWVVPLFYCFRRRMRLRL